jgi:hypothetical protein
MGSAAVIALTLAAFQASARQKFVSSAWAGPLLCSGSSGRKKTKPSELKVRPLFVDGRLKEYTAGSQHDVTERLFVFAADVSAERLASARCDAGLEVAAQRMVAG